MGLASLLAMHGCAEEPAARSRAADEDADSASKQEPRDSDRSNGTEEEADGAREDGGSNSGKPDAATDPRRDGAPASPTLGGDDEGFGDDGDGGDDDEAEAPSTADAGVDDHEDGSSPEAASGLPPVSDPGAKGPFAIHVEERLEGLDTHILIAPEELGRDGIEHPILVWVNGAGASSSSYRAMLDNVAAHGFFVLDDKQSTFSVPPEVEAQRAAIDWAIEQAELDGGPYSGKLDTSRIAIAGHSLGSVSTFGNVGDPRVKTSVHFAGGLLGNPQGVDEGWMDALHAPAAFLCGDRDSNGLPRVRRDFEGAPASVPVYFGLLSGAGHTDEFNEENGGRWGRFMIAWLRWQLAGDESFVTFFEGSDCEFCSGDWTAKKRNIE